MYVSGFEVSNAYTTDRISVYKLLRFKLGNVSSSVKDLLVFCQLDNNIILFQVIMHSYRLYIIFGALFSMVSNAGQMGLYVHCSI